MFRIKVCVNDLSGQTFDQRLAELKPSVMAKLSELYDEIEPGAGVEELARAMHTKDYVMDFGFTRPGAYSLPQDAK